MRIEILLTICLLGVVSGKDNIAFFKKLNKSEFGQTILETIQLELQNDSVDKIVLFLKQMQVDITAAQQENENNYQSRNVYFTQQINAADQVITKSKEQRASDQAQLPLRQEELSNKKDQAEDKVNEKQRNLDRIAALTTERETTKKQYDDKRGEIVGLVAALQQGKKLVQQVQTGAFVEVMQDLEKHHSNFVKRFPEHRGYTSLVSMSLSMVQDPAIKSDQNLIDKVVSILDDLADSLFQLQKQEMEADDARESAYQVAKARYEYANQHLAGSVAQLEASVQILVQRLLELKNDINSQEAQIKNKDIEKNDWKKSQKDELTAYNVNSDNRKYELELVVESLSIFESGSLQEDQKVFLQHLQIR